MGVRFGGKDGCLGIDVVDACFMFLFCDESMVLVRFS